MLLGRGAEREAIERLLAQARTGRSVALVMRGEAGIGKTALLEHARESASGFCAVRAVGVESEMEFAFAGLHQLCVPLLDRLAALPEPQQAALGVAFGLRAGNPPDRFLVGLATLNLLAEAAEGAATAVPGRRRTVAGRCLCADHGLHCSTGGRRAGGAGVRAAPPHSRLRRHRGGGRAAGVAARRSR